jgi:hypothetical protein
MLVLNDDVYILHYHTRPVIEEQYAVWSQKYNFHYTTNMHSPFCSATVWHRNIRHYEARPYIQKSVLLLGIEQSDVLHSVWVWHET